MFAVLDECAHQADPAGDERPMDARRGDVRVDLVLGPTGYRSQATSAGRDHTTQQSGNGHHSTQDASGASAARPRFRVSESRIWGPLGLVPLNPLVYGCSRAGVAVPAPWVHRARCRPWLRSPGDR